MNGPKRFGTVNAVLALVFVVAACGGATSGGGASKAPVEIGMAVALTGYLASSDAPLADGAKLAVNRINSSGGVDGRKFNLHVLDMASTAATAVTVTNQLLNQNNAGVMVNGSSSASTAAEAPIVAPRQVPMIVGSILPEDPKWTYSTLQPVSKQDDAELTFASKNLHASSIAILYSQTPYGQSSAKYMSEKASSYGLKIAVSLGIDTGSTDLSPQLVKVRDAGADVVLDILTGPVHLVLAKNAAGLGLKIPLVMGTDEVNIFKSSTDGYPNTYWIATPQQIYPNVANAKLKQADDAFVAAYKKEFGDRPGISNAGRGWDAIQILEKAVAASHANTGESLRAAIEHVSITGTGTEFAFTAQDHTGQSSVPNPLSIAQYQGSTFKVLYSASS